MCHAVLARSILDGAIEEQCGEACAQQVAQVQTEVRDFATFAIAFTFCERARESDVPILHLGDGRLLGFIHSVNESECIYSATALCRDSWSFTTFYNHLRCLDTLAWRGLYNLAVIRINEQSGEGENVQEVAIDRTHEDAPDAGTGHRAPCGGPDGLQYLEPETYPAR